MGEKANYYIGLDCGTSSVGWAVTDPEYKLLRLKGKTAWGIRLFKEADTAAERRIHRGARRRRDRADSRIKLLRELMAPEIAKVDKDFYHRMDESFYRMEDKCDLANLSADSLFNDPEFSDTDFHKKYHTIWHLRLAILNGNEKHFDIRLYFLAIQHILKHRGHFLRGGEMKGEIGNFKGAYEAFCQAADNAGFRIKRGHVSEVEQTILDKELTKNDAKKKLKALIIDDSISDDEDGKDGSLLAGLIIGSSVNLKKLFAVDGKNMNISFDKDVFEDKILEIEKDLEGFTAYVDLLYAAKAIYDYRIFKKLLSNDSRTISEAMVKNYNQHHEDLGALKKILRPYKEDYDYFFKSEKVENIEKKPNYNSYIGKAYVSMDKAGRKKPGLSNQVDVNKYLKTLIERHHIEIKDADFKTRLDNGELLPKQRGQAKGAIPQQAHHNELEIILDRLNHDYPRFAKIIPDEVDERYNTISKRIASLHSFRRPYYCGPLVTEDKSMFSWASEEIKEIVRPWNFERLANLSERAEGFIERMTGYCTYLPSEKVLPKSSLIYQKYMVFNEINNLKINGNRVTDQKIKLKIFELFESGSLTGNISIRRLEKELRNRKIIEIGDTLSGSAENKYFPKLSTLQDFKRILGDNFQKKYSVDKLEETVKAITILANDKKMLQEKIIKILSCSEEESESLSKLAYKDWGRFSKKLLCNIKVSVNGTEMSILDALEETCYNHMELLGQQFDFVNKINEINGIGYSKDKKNITYEDIDSLYCSPAVKRSVWQAIKIVKEIVKIKGAAPDKIFLESTRDQEDVRRKGETLSRRRLLQEKYNKIVENENVKELIDELDSKKDKDLQNKKLFLYFSQMGRCAYSGERIDLDDLMTSAYDIDHIYPRSKTKDDSITKNLVLVKAQLNREKTDIYPIFSDIRLKMSPTWEAWHRCGLISEEKLNRLKRGTRLTDEELGGFIARQIVETSETVKAIRDLFKRAYPDTEIVLVKAGQVSDFRRCYGYDREGHTGLSEFIKVRALNDFHHAKDAYLNIVVGNVMNETFTDDPVKWIRTNHPGEQKKYSIRTELIFREKQTYKNKLGMQCNWPYVQAWDFSQSLSIIRRALCRNDILFTRMPYAQSGELSDMQIVGKIKDDSAEMESLVPIKTTDRRLAKTARYGGYNSSKGAFFALIECRDKKGRDIRRIIQIPISSSKNPEQFINAQYPDAQILLPKILPGSLLNNDGFKMSLTGRTQDNLKFYPAVQISLSEKCTSILKKVLVLDAKIKELNKQRKTYKPEESDGLDDELLMSLFDELTQKLQNNFKKMPGLGGRIEDIVSSRGEFKKLDLAKKCGAILEIVKIMECNALAGNLTMLIPKSKELGHGTFSNNITNKPISLIHQSITGLIEHKVDLNKVQPRRKKD